MALVSHLSPDHLQLLDTILTFLAAIVSPIIVIWVNQRLRSRDKKKSHKVEKYIDSRIELSEICKTIAEYLNATRCNIFLFHNGGYYYTGEPMQKMSVIAEYNNPTVEPISDKFQNIPVEIFIRILNHLKSSDWVTELNEVKNHDTLGVLNALYSTHSFLSIKLINEAGLWVGIAMVSFSDHRHVSSKDITYATSFIPQMINLLKQ